MRSPAAIGSGHVGIILHNPRKPLVHQLLIEIPPLQKRLPNPSVVECVGA